MTHHDERGIPLDPVGRLGTFARATWRRRYDLVCRDFPLAPKTERRKFMKLTLTRRQIVKTGAALGASTLFSPPILTFAQGETPIKIGMHDPLTGTYAA